MVLNRMMKWKFQDTDLIILNEKYELNLGLKRIKHMTGVKKLVKQIAESLKLDNSEEISEIFKLHDIARNMKAEKQQEFIPHIDIIDIEKNNPVLLHAPIAAYMLRNSDLYTDNSDNLLYAVRYHTLFEHAERETFELKLLTVCDFCEYERKFTEAETLRKVAFENLDKAYEKMKIIRKEYYLKHEKIN